MREYQCHKRVHAAKILSIGPSETDRHILFLEPMVGPLVSAEWVAKHKPQPGGYYVIYEDGYTSYSPAAAFESGYTLIEQKEDAKPDALSEKLNKQFGLY